MYCMVELRYHRHLRLIYTPKIAVPFWHEYFLYCYILWKVAVSYRHTRNLNLFKKSVLYAYSIVNLKVVLNMIFLSIFSSSECFTNFRIFFHTVVTQSFYLCKCWSFGVTLVRWIRRSIWLKHDVLCEFERQWSRRSSSSALYMPV